MATVTPRPLAVCDVCGAREEKRHGVKEGEWKNPLRWGSLKVDPTHFGTYPNSILLPDVCPDCLSQLHTAVSNQIDAIKQVIAERPRT